MRMKWRRKNNLIHIERELLKAKFAIKFEIKKIILKSIQSNKNTKPIIRAYANYKLSQILKKTSIAKQKNICLQTGRFKGIYKLTSLSRHQMKKLFINNNLQNIQINSW